MIIVDPHVHLRWNEYPDNDFIGLAERDCLAVGISAVGEMPNMTPALTCEKTINERISKNTSMHRWINVGITTDLEQVRTVARFDKPLKMFLIHSTGDMGILDPELQKQIWKILSGYKDKVVMMHCEDAGEWQTLYDPRFPMTHSLRQNPESEYLSVEYQLRFAIDSGFRGTFYVCHVSNPATLQLLKKPLRSLLRFRTISEVTWHHLFLNYDDYKIHGNLVKMNPPLRSQKMQESLLESLLRGEIDLIGSDHAPHPVYDKIQLHRSGIPALPFWPKGIDLLRKLEVDENKLQWMCGWRARQIFMIPDSICKHSNEHYDPLLWEAYGWNPFSRIDSL